MTSIECPVCRENKVAFVTFECQHKICLNCYHNCMYHNHTKCSLCRKDIPELAETCELIKDVEKRVDELEQDREQTMTDFDNITGLYEDLQDRFDEIWAQFN